MKIAAVVVSFNRFEDLKLNLGALREQTRPLDGIIIVDNGSTDGAVEWLRAQPDVQTILQSNLGAAGGFRAGIALAMQSGYDWCWLLDDDAHPAPDALAELCRAMNARPDARILNSIGVSRTDPERFAVGALWVREDPNNYLDGTRIETRTELGPFVDADGIVDSIGGHFYHGVLLHHTVVEQVGAPLPWLYLCGEEVEYGLRIMRAGYHIYTVPASIVYHPEIPFASLHALGKTKAFEIRNPYRRYYFIRNSLWIRRTYYGEYPFLPYVARRLGGALLAELYVIPNRSWRNRIAGAGASLRGVRDGLRLKPARDANGKEILT